MRVMSKRQRPRAGAEASDVVRHEWLRRVEAEYRSAAVTGQLANHLIVLAAPPGLIRSALRIVADELRHAELSHRVYRESGGDGGPQLARESLQHAPTAPSLEQEVTRVCVQSFCLGETA